MEKDKNSRPKKGGNETEDLIYYGATRSIDKELRTFMEQSFIPAQELEAPTTGDFAERVLSQVVKRKFPEDDDLIKRAFNQWLPLARFLASSKTIENFNDLKSLAFNLLFDDRPELKRNTLNPRLHRAGKYGLPAGLTKKRVSEQGTTEQWSDAADWFIDLSKAFKIMPPGNVKDIKSLQAKGRLGGPIFDEVELGKASPFTKIHESVEELERWIETLRYSDHAARRVGMIIGDFRVGDHSAHGLFFENAKRALGDKGKLVVISPSKETILNTTDKVEVWDDRERLYRLGSHMYIDQVLIADMPDEHYDDPGIYWRDVWRRVAPDFVFLGEVNHPLESVYEEQSGELGGILLIDEQPVTIRSRDLLR